MLDIAHANVLITGGASGIGRGLAERLLRAGAKVLVTGRDQEKLAALARASPGLLTFQSDIGRPEDREGLARHVAEAMPQLNVVINNAGIQRRVGLAEDRASWSERQKEIDILLAGPVHLNSMLLPTMLEGQHAGLIVNVTSGGAYIPQPFAPLYAACKAALHSYTVTLRHALRDAPIRVVELIPPAVATGMAGPGNNHGAPVDEFCDTVFARIVQGDADEVGYGATDSEQFKAAQQTYKDMFTTFAPRFSTATYASQGKETPHVL